MATATSSDIAERLKILASIPPLWDPKLPSPPPSPRSSASRKRTISDLNRASTNDVAAIRADARDGTVHTVGLGLIHDEQPSSKRRDSDTRMRSASASLPAAAATRDSASTHTASSSVAPTPRIRQGADSPWIGSAPSVSGPPLSPWLGKPGQDWHTAYPKERLRKLAAKYRDCGRSLKHAGDAIAKEARTGPRGKLALAKQTEAILLYAFAFWCDDQAAKACIPSNWKSIFGLLAFVKSRAEKDKLGIVIGLCLRIEALAVFALTMHEQKLLHHQGVKLLSSSSSSSNARSRDPPPPRLPPPPPPPLPLSASAASPAASNDGSAGTSAHSPTDGNSAASAHPGPSLPPPPPPPPHPSSASTVPSSTDLIKQFTRSGSELFRVQRLWEDSCTYLDSKSLVDKLGQPFWSVCVEMNVRIDPKEFCLPVKQQVDTAQEEGEVRGRVEGSWLFAWPIEVNRPMSVPHTVAFGRAVLEEWCKTEGVTDFESAVVSES
ncbi:hypothetical protein ACM66B_004646 [Microbotryomycetes sp. NB124-2]